MDEAAIRAKAEHLTLLVRGIWPGKTAGSTYAKEIEAALTAAHNAGWDERGEKVSILLKTLRFYAGHHNWRKPAPHRLDPTPRVLADNGKKARTTLKVWAEQRAVPTFANSLVTGSAHQPEKEK